MLFALLGVVCKGQVFFCLFQAKDATDEPVSLTGSSLTGFGRGGEGVLEKKSEFKEVFLPSNETGEMSKFVLDMCKHASGIKTKTMTYHYSLDLLILVTLVVQPPFKDLGFKEFLL